jgi:hypothetical protein
VVCGSLNYFSFRLEPINSSAPEDTQQANTYFSDRYLEPIRKVSNAYRKVTIGIQYQVSVQILHIAYYKSYSR